MNIYLEKLIGVTLIIVGVLYFRKIDQRGPSKTIWGVSSKHHGYIASVAIIVLGIVLLFGLRGVLKH